FGAGDNSILTRVINLMAIASVWPHQPHLAVAHTKAVRRRYKCNPGVVTRERKGEAAIANLPRHSPDQRYCPDARFPARDGGICDDVGAVPRPGRHESPIHFESLEIWRLPNSLRFSRLDGFDMDALSVRVRDVFPVCGNYSTDNYILR